MRPWRGALWAVSMPVRAQERVVRVLRDFWARNAYERGAYIANEDLARIDDAVTAVLEGRASPVVLDELRWVRATVRKRLRSQREGTPG